MEAITQVLAEVTRDYSDTRVHLCRLEVAQVSDAHCALSGTVLDGETLVDVLARLAARCPGVACDTSAVRVLRESGVRRVVATNLTGLYAQSSFLSEQLSQVLNGARLEALLEEGRWCFVRQPDGYLGWVYGPYLAEPGDQAPTHQVCEPVSLLRAAPAADAALVNRALAGTPVVVTEEAEGWARLVLAGDPAAPLRPALTGWAPESDVRNLAALPADASARRSQIVADAMRFVGVPYLWGGGSALGIDCSGFAQLLHRLSGITLPRDADMQFDAGQPVEPPFRPADLLFFGEVGERRKITHVGVSLGGWHIIHSSRSRNGVHEDDVQAVAHLRESFVGARTFVAQ